MANVPTFEAREMNARCMVIMTRLNDLMSRQLYSRPLTQAEQAESMALEAEFQRLTEQLADMHYGEA